MNTVRWYTIIIQCLLTTAWMVLFPYINILMEFAYICMQYSIFISDSFAQTHVYMCYACVYMYMCVCICALINKLVSCTCDECKWSALSACKAWIFNFFFFLSKPPPSRLLIRLGTVQFSLVAWDPERVCCLNPIIDAILKRIPNGVLIRWAKDPVILDLFRSQKSICIPSYTTWKTPVGLPRHKLKKYTLLLT